MAKVIISCRWPEFDDVFLCPTPSPNDPREVLWLNEQRGKDAAIRFDGFVPALDWLEEHTAWIPAPLLIRLDCVDK